MTCSVSVTRSACHVFKLLVKGCHAVVCVFVSVALDTLHYTLFFALVNTFLHKIINFFLTLILGLFRGFLLLVGKCSHKGIKSL